MVKLGLSYIAAAGTEDSGFLANYFVTCFNRNISVAPNSDEKKRGKCALYMAKLVKRQLAKFTSIL